MGSGKVNTFWNRVLTTVSSHWDYGPIKAHKALSNGAIPKLNFLVSRRISVVMSIFSVFGLSYAGRKTNLTPVAGLNLLREKVSIPQTQTQSSLFSISVLLCSFMNPPPSVFSNRERKSPQRGRERTLERMQHQCNTITSPHLAQCVVLSESD